MEEKLEKKEKIETILKLCCKNNINILDLIEKITNEFCDNYCKYSALIEYEDELYTHCDNCPFVNLF